MFGLGKMLQSCGSGCRLLWNDPVKQAEGYGTVSKEDGGMESDDPFEFDDEPDLIFTQPYPKTIWSDSTMHSPIVKNVTVSTNGTASTSASSMFNSPIVKKSVPVVKDISPSDTRVHTSSQKQSPVIQNSIERPSPHVGVHSSVYTKKSSPEVTRKAKTDESVSIQMVSVV
ncbi:uncharacterized protein LOC132547411 [Ylistrum balloti]|uniref:uncharacterized protein LOC132547411 n=1 Tax=Ylistrum balloti TaxID=509963 RepID=UPI002905E6A8|nr:uncharacterized protein LOC132547411 [Ylistrum balloti]